MSAIAPTLTLDKELHIYRYGDQLVPSVTEILKGAGLVDDRWFTEQGRWRGSVVHLACWYDDQGDLDEQSINEEVMAHVRAWRKFRAETGFTPTSIEEPIFNELMSYAGTPDRVGGLGDGRPCVADLKSGASSKTTRYQTVAYAACLPSPRKYTRMEVRTMANGNYSLKVFPPSDYQKDIATWASIVDMYHLRRELGIL
jgi:hypothetical protein